ncbi:Hypothetical predicted protein [Xyrichtys novacula]|uniref:Uncharacterized protein n=1 Tax=Xyrichtys novacula TaxID=13765 RepID=A0AAV1F9P4_XYRNO|nr:Hypothetical predicted protein [Xyrichtys novacula]
MSAVIVLILIFFLTCCIVPILRRQCGRLTEKQMGLIASLALAHEMHRMPPKQLAQCVMYEGGTEGPERFLDFEGDEDEQWTLSNTKNISSE